ncbi:secretin receptor [Callorhinchus milii]|uniref:Secretin receptor n=1 Tax=Callorhinchus milii TaxID=7868 RepID=A0A4W3HJW0_CALMI|nr:secretin receptor [Callorhinchus milii]|eukprot:gi/632957197/ref/XP_007894350.1/ PREDICTED: secretin receptor [Callorhinchus milii]
MCTSAAVQGLGLSYTMRTLLFLIYLDILLTVKATPPECNLQSILESERDQCYKMPWNFINSSEILGVDSGCIGMWDNLTCWPSSSLGQTVAVSCPKLFYVLIGKEGFVYRNCTSEGWSEPFPVYGIACGFDVNDPTNVAETSYYVNVKMMYTIGYSLSFISLSIAIAILGFFRKLHCTRNYIHMHLFMSYILRAVSIFIKDSVLFSNDDRHHCNTYSVECKVVMVFFQYCIMANFSWLLVEGMYLHTLLVVSVFSERKYFWWYIVLGWGGPSIFIMPWAIARQVHENIGCWDVNSDEWIWWIIKGPVILSIFINLILFVRIIGILIKKLTTTDLKGKDFSQYRRLAKSTLLLIPLFGVHYVVLAILPDAKKQLAIEMRLCFELAFGAYQGLVVAVLYCFLNGEVRAEVKRKWRRWRLKKYFAVDLRNQQSSIISNGVNGGTQVSLLTGSSTKKQQEFTLQESSVF